MADVEKSTSMVGANPAVADEEPKPANSGPCGLFTRFPTLTVLLFAGAGIGIGFLLSNSDMDPNDRKEVVKWIGLVGVLFIRALKAVVLPLVFLNVILAVVDMLSLGKAVSVGWKTLGLYLLTTLIAAVIGLISVLMFKGQFIEGASQNPPGFSVSLQCPTSDGTNALFLSQVTNATMYPGTEEGDLVCLPESDGAAKYFEFDDVDGQFQDAVRGKKNDISLSDTIYQGVFLKVVSTNIVADFVNANFASVVLFAVVFGVALHRVVHKPNKAGISSVTVTFLRELDGVFLQIINWIIAITPLAVLSLIVNAVGNKDNLADDFANVGFLVICTLVAMLTHFVVVHLILFFFITRSNPLTYLRHIVPAMTMAFACASSAATIPVTLRCVANSGQVPDAVRKFVVPLGATINMDGGAIYFPAAVIFMAVVGGLGDQITAATYVLLIIISTIGSAGTAPVPSASLVLIITAFNTVFNTTNEPAAFGLILTVDWLMDRFRTALNVTGDAMVARMVASLASFEVLDEEALREVELEIEEETNERYN